MTSYASWVHGNAFAVQFPGGNGLEFTNGSRMDQVDGHAFTDVTGLHTGPGITYVANGADNNYFHVALPTPVLTPGGRAVLNSVFVLFDSTQDYAVIDQIWAFDGATPIYSWGGDPDNGNVVTVSGQHDGSQGLSALQPGSTQFDLPDPHAVLWGIGLSVHMTFSRYSRVTFSAAGADFDMA
jgi:hypothetical protein